MSLRKSVLWIHLWLGLFAAIPLILIGLTGAAIAFEDELGRLLNPKLSWVTPRVQPLSLTAIQARLEKAYPKFRFVSIQFREQPDLAWSASLQAPSLRAPSRPGLNIAFDPYDAAVLGSGSTRNTLMNQVHQFHTHLLAGDTGEVIVGWEGVLLFLLAATGFYLWWPRKVFIVNWRGGWKKTNFDLHQAAGILSLFFLLGFSITGMIIHWEDEFRELGNRAAGSADLAPFPESRPIAPEARPLNPDRLLAIANRAVPGARATVIDFAGNPAHIGMKYPEDRTPAGRTHVFIDSLTGDVVYRVTSRTGPFGFRLVNVWNRQIHTGDIGGLPTRIVACAMSLSVPLLAVTGPMIWFNKRRRRPLTSRRASSDRLLHPR